MTLAEIAVKLTANTAEFISGFGNAGVATKRFRADLSEHVQAIGGALDGALSHFGEFGAVLGQTLDTAAQAAGRAVSSFGKLGGAAGTIVGVGAGAAAALLAIEGGAVALAVKTAFATAQLGELSAKTGISTETLAGLGVSARETGVPMEALGKALGFMNNNVVKAAIAPSTTRTAFQRLGVDVRDATGKIRESGEVFEDVVRKIHALRQPEQGFFAKQIFGRGGQELLPVINLEPDRLVANKKLSDTLGLGDAQTVAASRKFKETIEDIGTEFTGIAVRLTKDLLPALEFISQKVADAFKSGRAQGLIDDIAKLTKGTAVFAFGLIQAFDEIGLVFEFIGGTIIGTLNAIGATGEALLKLALFDYKGAKEAAKQGLAGVTDEFKHFYDVSASHIKNTKEFARGAFAAQQTFTIPKPGEDISNSTKERDGALERIRARIEGLNEEAKGWEKVAAAGTESEQFILEAMKKADAEFAKLKAEAAKSPAATAFVLKNEGTIKAAEEEIFFGESVKKAITELDKQKGKLEEQDKAAIQLGNAYKLGGDAIREALVKAEFAQQAAVVQDLVAKHEQAVKVFGEESKQAKILADGVNVATQELNALVQAGINKKLHTIANVLSDESRSLAEQAPFVEKLGNAYLQGETAVRRARIELELLNYTLKNNLDPSKDSALIAQKRQLLIDADKQSYDLALKQEAAQFSLNAQYDDQIIKLERVREILQESGQSTLLIDAKIHDSQDSLLHQWDEAAFKVGTFGQKFQGVMGEVVIQGRAAGQAIAQAFVGAIDGIETNLAKLLTGQKTNFKGVVQNLAEQVTKAEIQKGVGAIAQSLGFGDKFKELIKGKPDGTQNNPLFVSIADVTSKGSSGLGKGLGGLGSLLGGKDEDQAAAGNPSANAANPLAKLFGGSSGGGSAIASLFGSAIGGAQGGLFGGGSKVKTGKGAPAQPVIVENPVTAMIFTPVRVIVTNPITIAGAGATGLPGAGGGSSLTSLGLSTALGRLGGGLPGIGGLTSLGSLFGGFRAGGGDMSPGNWYIAGERGPEIVKGPGSVIPASKFSSGHNITQNFNYPNAASRDLFGFTERQHAARHQRSLKLAY